MNKKERIKLLIDDSMKPYLYKQNPILFRNYENLYKQNKLINLVRQEEFIKLIKEFPTIILLKGMELSLNYYKDPGVRPFEDIDILISKRDIKHIEKFFHSNGYKRFNRAEKLNSFEYYKYPAKFHIHTSLANAIYPQPYMKTFDMELKDFTKTELLDGLRYRRLEENFNFLYITFHNLKHNFDSGIRVIDIIVVAKFVNWQIVYDLSQKLKCYNMLITTLNLLFSKEGEEIINKGTRFFKSHSGLDLAIYLRSNPSVLISFLPLLSKNITRQMFPFNTKVDKKNY
ncbi:MAG: nucleotidyltransferase family protein [Planctomycetota bacterium]